ncbi:MAG: hypothetical protein HQL71_09870 [Magnetococcales bacterium]|nr:hypothetical protein [Magnetococcales bacterium]
MRIWKITEKSLQGEENIDTNVSKKVNTRTTFFQRLFLIGILVFLLPKLTLILSQTQIMDQPRLGDDGLALMWRGEQINVMGFGASRKPIDETAPRALRDITKLCPQLNTYNVTDNQKWCERAARGFARPHYFNGSNILAAALLKFGLEVKWTFAIYEVVILTFATLGFSYLLLRTVGPPAAGIGLMLLSFINVPSAQGLHQFVPSVLVMGLSMGLWATLIGCQTWKGVTVALIGFPLLSLFHPIAILFAGGGVLILIIENLKNSNFKRVAKIAIIGSLTLILIMMATKSVRDVIMMEFTTSFVDNFGQNISALPNFFFNFAYYNSGLTILFILSFFMLKRSYNRSGAVISLVLIAMMLISLTHISRYYTQTLELDLFSRFFLCFALITSGISGKLILSFLDGIHKWRIYVASMVILASLLAGAPAWFNALWHNPNRRVSTVNISSIAEGLEALPDDSTIAYGEIDIAMPSVFLAGGHNKGAIPIKGIAPSQLAGVLNERRPYAVVTPQFQRLNTLAVSQNHSLSTREYGINGQYHDAVVVGSHKKRVQSLFVKFVNYSKMDQIIGPNLYTAQNGQQQFWNITVPNAAEKWIEIKLPQELDIRNITIILPDAQVWIKGILVNDKPNGQVNWPWSNNSMVGWRKRGDTNSVVQAITFTPSSLLHNWGVPQVISQTIRLNNPVLSDKGGIVLMITKYGKKN